MDFELLKHFIAVAEHKNITRAAESLYTTQPTLSKHIAMLEDQMGAKLLLRNNRMVELTEAGRVLYEEGQALLSHIAGIEAKVLRTQSGYGGIIRALSESMDYDPIHNFYNQFSENFPEIDFSVQHVLFREIISGLDAQSADVGLVRSFEVEAPQYSQRYDIFRLYSTHMMVAVANNHHLTTRDSVKLSELKGEPMVYMKHLIDAGSRFWAELIDRTGCVLEKNQCITVEDVLFFLRGGHCLSFVDKNSHKHYTPETGCKLIEIEDESFSFDILMLINKSNGNRALDTFKRAILPFFSGSALINKNS